MKVKVLCIGDSLALPGHLNKYEDTWICKLKSTFPNFDFITYFQRTLTTDVLVTMGGGPGDPNGFNFGSDCLEAFMPDFVILQLGIVDCAPRLFRKASLESRILKYAPAFIRKNYISLVKKFRKRNAKKAYIPPNRFEENLLNYFERCSKNNVSKVIIIGIPYPDDKMICKNHEIIKSVTLYNGIFEKCGRNFKNISVIYPLNARKYNSEIYEDGYHPNKLGHYLIFRDLKKFLNKYE